MKEMSRFDKSKATYLICLPKQYDQARENYRVLLTMTLDCIQFLLCQGLTFHGRDETESFHNIGNFLELLRLLADHSEIIKSVVL